MVHLPTWTWICWCLVMFFYGFDPDGIQPTTISENICYFLQLGGGFKHFNVHPYLGKWSNLTNIFQMGWNRQLVILSKSRWMFDFYAIWQCSKTEHTHPKPHVFVDCWIFQCFFSHGKNKDSEPDEDRCLETPKGLRPQEMWIRGFIHTASHLGCGCL